MSLKLPIVYIRGLNTSGSNLLTLGWIPLPTSMYRPWLQFFSSQGVQAYAIDNLGGGLLIDQTNRAEEYLDRIKPHLENGFHIVAHSAGGLVAWALASRPYWQEKVKSVTTLATPHQGAGLAQVFLDFTQKQDFRIRTLSRIGYNHERRIPIFKEFLPESVLEFKEKNPFPKSIPLYSYSFCLKIDDMSWPIRWTHQMGFTLPDCDHDGFIELNSQQAGTHLGTWELDHSSQLGYHFYLDRKVKAQKTRLFLELTLDLLSNLKSLEASSSISKINRG